MRQDLLDAFNNILSNPELKSRFDKIKKPDDVYAVFKDAGYPGSSEELDNEIRSVVEDFVKSKNASDGDLSGVVGGKGSRFSNKMIASALALMGIASTASGNALYALNGNSFENAKSFVEKQMKNPAVKNALGYGVTAVGAMSLGGILMWALMRNPKSPHLKKICKYATSANEALVEFKKAYEQFIGTPYPTQVPVKNDSEDVVELPEEYLSPENKIRQARETFKDKMLGIIDKMESDKLFLDSWQNVTDDVRECINDENLNIENAYYRVCVVFYNANIVHKGLRDIIENGGTFENRWADFYNKLGFCTNNTDLRFTYMDKETFEKTFDRWALSNIVSQHNLSENSLFYKADEQGQQATDAGASQDQNINQDNDNPQNSATNTAILAKVYTALQENDPERTYNAFIDVLTEMGIAKKYAGKTYDDINNVFEWINLIITDIEYKNTFEKFYNFLIEDKRNNGEFINLMKKIATNGEIEIGDINKFENQVNNFWNNNTMKFMSPSYVDKFVVQHIKFFELVNRRPTLNVGTTQNHVDRYKNWKDFHALQTIESKADFIDAYLTDNVGLGRFLINIEYIKSDDALYSAYDESIIDERARAENTSNRTRVAQINYFESFFRRTISNNISLSDIGIDKNALDIFD